VSVVIRKKEIGKVCSLSYQSQLAGAAPEVQNICRKRKINTINRPRDTIEQGFDLISDETESVFQKNIA
jgi:hypothetical protein